MAGWLYMQRTKCLYLFHNVCFLFLIFWVASHIFASNTDFKDQFIPSNFNNNHEGSTDSDISCKGLQRYNDNKAKCSYVKSHKGCQSRGYISYLQILYCTFSPALGYTLLILWLILLFYLLGDTAAKYFCSTLKGLSRVLGLSPTIAGATLLALGNGAPDVFSSLVSFMGGDGTQDVGLNSILGGAFFVSSVVVGIISLTVGNLHQSISKSSFVRDVLFFLFSLSCLVLIIIIGKINLWGAIAFLCLYLIYVCCVSATQLCGGEEQEGGMSKISSESPVLQGFLEKKPEGPNDLEAPILGGMVGDGDRPNSDDQGVKTGFSTSHFIGKLVCFLEMPLYLPRRLTIPVVDAEKWSKPFAVLSVTIAPILLAVIWNSTGLKPSVLIYAIGGSVGTVSGIVVFFITERSIPPRKCLLLWLGGGFLMSIIWTYFLAQELISLLVSLGVVLGINPSILGLTVLAWGNSLGDLVANVAMAKNGGPDEAQLALSGCYAGPIFNTVVGLGISLSFAVWNQYPSIYVIPKDPYVYETLGFLMCGLGWALVMLLKNSMKLDRRLGVGLLAIYLCFLLLKMARALGVLQSDLWSSHPKT